MMGQTNFSTLPNNPDAPGYWTQYANVQTMALQVSPVPEPAPFALLAAGLVTLGLRRRSVPLHEAGRHQQ
jgi:hypothetical protein